jgi:ribosomal protein S18 acetylase RimI-like enzyme
MPRDADRTPRPVPAISIQQAETATDLDGARTLFLEYIYAPGWEPEFRAYLAQQSFDAELAQLPGPYAPPAGALLLARIDGQLAGCVAAKALEPPAICEMKRLFVRPAFRTFGVGEQLVREVMLVAAGAGYERMRLDTLPSMRAAQQLYRRLGFEEIPPYCANPVPNAYFMERRLDAVITVTPRPAS